jgi:hypothetical protein
LALHVNSSLAFGTPGLAAVFAPGRADALVAHHAGDDRFQMIADINQFLVANPSTLHCVTA